MKRSPYPRCQQKPALGNFPTDQPYGQHEYGASDCGGCIWSFATRTWTAGSLAPRRRSRHELGQTDVDRDGDYRGRPGVVDEGPGTAAPQLSRRSRRSGSVAGRWLFPSAVS
jgi:hypothetical protein